MSQRRMNCIRIHVCVHVFVCSFCFLHLVFSHILLHAFIYSTFLPITRNPICRSTESLKLFCPGNKICTVAEWFLPSCNDSRNLRNSSYYNFSCRLRVQSQCSMHLSVWGIEWLSGHFSSWKMMRCFSFLPNKTCSSNLLWKTF